MQVFGCFFLLGDQVDLMVYESTGAVNTTENETQQPAIGVALQGK